VNYFISIFFFLKSKKDISTWFDLFADLDPLQNPDAIGSNKNDVEEEEQRNC